MQTDCIILGGGAAGLTAAAALAERGLQVMVVEKLDRVGKKLLATGNGRCNLSNRNMDAAQYGCSAAFVERVYANAPPAQVLSFLENLGLMTLEEEGRLYPRSMQASAVLDVLRMACSRGQVTLLTGEEVTDLRPSRRGGWSVALNRGQGLFAPVVLCALGGSAAPSLGTDGSGVRLMSALGHTATPCVPALVQLQSRHPALRSLKGIRVQAMLTLHVDGAPVATECGELLFTDYGLSGVCVFQLSRTASRALAQKRSVAVHVHLLPEVPSLRSWLDARIARHPDEPCAQLMTGVLHRLLAHAVLKDAGISPEQTCGTLSDAARCALCNTLSSWSFPVTGTQGFAQAQVTAGGIVTDEIDPETMASRLYDGLYLAGEVIDVDGPCGGYNLHFAFASALVAARAMAAQITGQKGQS